MRKIKYSEISVFSALIILITLISLMISKQFYEYVAPSDFICSLVFVTSFYFLSFMTYKVLILIIPHPIGEIPLNSLEERIFHFYTLWWIIFFNQIFRSYILPTPIHTFMYKLLGAKIGNNSFTAGIMYDPTFIEIGDNVLLGHGTLLTPHILIKDKIFFSKIIIGDNVSVGVNAVIFAGVIIESGGQVMAGSIVRPSTIIKKGEVFGGIPAKKIVKSE